MQYRKRIIKEITIDDTDYAFRKGDVVDVYLPVNEKYYYLIYYCFNNRGMLAKYYYKTQKTHRVHRRLGWQVIELNGKVADQITFDLRGRVIDDHPGNIKLKGGFRGNSTYKK